MMDPHTLKDHLYIEMGAWRLLDFNGEQYSTKNMDKCITIKH